jgi:hypothetical protein
MINPIYMLVGGGLTSMIIKPVSAMIPAKSGVAESLPEEVLGATHFISAPLTTVSRFI